MAHREVGEKKGAKRCGARFEQTTHLDCAIDGACGRTNKPAEPKRVLDAAPPLASHGQVKRSVKLCEGHTH